MSIRVGVLPPRGNDRIEMISEQDGRDLAFAGLARWVNRCKDIRLNGGEMYVEDPEARKKLAPLVRLLTGAIAQIRGASANIKVRTMDQAVIEGKPGAWVKVEAYRYRLA